jgi:molybdopterin-guanine dinucleotide biosynthesis protein A
MTKADLFGLVLAGGLSTRMGCDKAKLRYGRLPQREQVAALLRKFCSKVYISVRAPEPSCPLPVLCDRFPSEGPMAGILTALTFKPEVCWLVAPVDMPALDESTLRFLIQNHIGKHTVTCFRHATDHHPEPLLAVWNAHSASPLMHYYQQGGRSVRAFIESAEACMLEAPDAAALINVNTTADMRAFLRQRNKKSL